MPNAHPFPKRTNTYRRALREVEHLCDALGMPVDKGIKPLIAAFRMYGIRTLMSCEGHANRALPYPWVDIDLADAAKATILLGKLGVGPRRLRTDRRRERIGWMLDPFPWCLRFRPQRADVPLKVLQRQALRIAEKMIKRHR